MEASNSLSNELGSGGFGKVFLANNLRSKGTKAAIKVLNLVIFHHSEYCAVQHCFIGRSSGIGWEYFIYPNKG